MKHIFTVPCDSHGLQLIFKDLLQQPIIKQYWNLATTIVNTLRNSGKQHSNLYEEQEKVYKGKRKALIALGITRWGTQYNLLKSINDSKEALRSFAFRDDADHQLKAILTQHTFWAAITELLELFKPIHEAQKMSEDNKATISYVYSRWSLIEEHLKSFANSSSFFAADVRSYLGIDSLYNSAYILADQIIQDIYGSRHNCKDCRFFDLCFRCIIDVARIHQHGHRFEVIEG